MTGTVDDRPDQRFSRPAEKATPDRGIRPDIQLLRAVAVGIVLLYHLWPLRMPGGFVGVDVFFVISGFLITSHLLRSAESAGGVRLGRFWANRARRLLPLACLVLLATLLATVAFMPPSAWLPTVGSVLASAFYVQNWLLASNSVDYLARDQQPLPTQQYWSLSVEEQFYIVWPLLMLAAVWWVRRRRSTASGRGRGGESLAVRRAVFGVIAVVFLASLTYSIVATTLTPGLAYFSTASRAWEFAAGGLLAFLVGRAAAGADNAPAVRALASWVGAALVIGTAFLLQASTPFPGVVAVVPVLGSALLIWAGPVTRWAAPSGLWRVRPLTYLGDISYGIYLWHWPIIVIVGAAITGPLRWLDKVILVALTVGLAALSKVYVEDVFRFRRFWTTSTLRGILPGTVGIAVVAVACLITSHVIRADAPVAVTPSATALVDPVAEDQPLIPTVATRGIDRAQMYDCFDFDKSGPHVCTYGAADSTTNIALVGDSHAAHLIPGMVEAAETNGWRLTVIVGLSCDAGLSAACGGAEQGFQDIVDGRFDLVVFGAFRGSSSPADEVTEYVTRLQAAGVRLLPVVDVPQHPAATFACVDASDDDPVAVAACTTPRDVALNTAPDRVGPIAESLGLPVLDLTDVFCDASVCRSLLGNVLVYQDTPSSHLTATASRLLSPLFAKAVQDALAR